MRVETIFKNVRELLNGHVLKIVGDSDQPTIAHEICFFVPRVSNDPINQQSSLDFEISSELSDLVDNHMSAIRTLYPYGVVRCPPPSFLVDSSRSIITTNQGISFTIAFHFQNLENVLSLGCNCEGPDLTVIMKEIEENSKSNG